MPSQRALCTLLLAAAAGCATAPRAPAIAAEVVWPEPPAAPRVRLVTTLPEPATVSRWRRFVDAVVGLSRKPAGSALQRPFGVAVAADGAAIVADPDLPGVVRVEGSRVTPVGCDGRDWAAPMAVSLARDGALLVADAGAGEIVRIAPNGHCSVFGAGELERPTGVAGDGGSVFVADPPRHEVVVFSGASVSNRVGQRGEGQGDFDFPTAVALAPDGTLLVVDALNFRVVRLSPSGAWLGTFGEAGDAGGAFARPKGIAVGGDGRIYVSDAQRDAVLVFHADGSFDYAIGATGTAPGLFTHPAGLAVAGHRLFVADSQNHRIQVFEILGERS